MPVIRPGDSYDYVSGCPLECSSGSMEGRYKLVVADGAMIEDTKFFENRPRV